MTQKGLLTLILLVLCTYGCSARSIHFESRPAGAVVAAGSEQCTTPCTMEVACEAEQALFVDAYQKEITAELPACDELDNFVHEANNATGNSLKVAAMPFGAVAVLSYLVFISDDDEDPGDLTVHEDAGLLAIASGSVALLLYGAGEFFHYLNSKQEAPTVRADFYTGRVPEYRGPLLMEEMDQGAPLKLGAEGYQRLYE